MQVLWNPPALPGEFDPVEALLNDPNSGLERRHQFMTATEFVSDFFESNELQGTFLENARFPRHIP